MKTISNKFRAVIPVYNATEDLTECIQSIINSSKKYSNFEIIVVDNGKNNGLKDRLKNYPVQILVKDKQASAAYARNEGAANFNQGILLFFDSDVVIQDNCIDVLIQPILENKCIATFGSYSKDVSTLNFAQKFKQLYVNYIYNRDNTTVKNFFWTAICAIDTAVFQELNGFDVGFKGANSEDVEFGIRLTKYGHKILPVKSANGVHRHQYTVTSIFKNDFRKGVTSLKNIRSNKIPITDNNHAKKTDIMAVIFASLTSFTILGGAISFYFFFLSVIFLFIWLGYRQKLLRAFAFQGNIFLIKSTFLVFALEIIRALCVIFCLISPNTKKANENYA